MKISVNRFTLSLFYWTSPAIEWNQRGYDGYWTDWGVYPLFNFEALDPYLWEDREPVK